MAPVSPFQGLGLFGRDSQGVALSFIVSAFQATGLLPPFRWLILQVNAPVRLKGADNTARGNALGIPWQPVQALKGRQT